MDIIFGHSYEGDRPRNRANCGLHSLPMDDRGSHLRLVPLEAPFILWRQAPSLAMKLSGDATQPEPASRIRGEVCYLVVPNPCGIRSGVHQDTNRATSPK